MNIKKYVQSYQYFDMIYDGGGRSEYSSKYVSKLRY